MQIVHISFECFPIAKVGGLADVVGALPKYQNELGHDAIVLMPFYQNDTTTKSPRKVCYQSTIRVGNEVYEFAVQRLIQVQSSFEIYLIRIPRLLDRKKVYGYPDDLDRFLGFQSAALLWINQLQQKPDIVHCHDHHVGLIPFLMRHGNRYESLRHTPTIFTIHNAQYQGSFGHDLVYKIPEFDLDYKGILEWNGQINPLAAAIKSAWRVSTVSPTYMKELQIQANGLEELLKSEKQKCFGILNGIDNEIWNPETDPMLVKNFKPSTLFSGKKANKKWLSLHYNLSMDLPLFAFIGRLVGEKGADLLPEVISDTLDNLPVNLLILGSGFTEIEKKLKALKTNYAERYHAHIGYDERLSHIVYAGADFLIMPSRVEPCGLNQMYALRYGTIPIVRRTGGLKDTVVDIGDNGFGICHDQALVWDICYSIKRANQLYSDMPLFRKIQKKIMKKNHSWNHSAQQYLAMYESLLQHTVLQN